MVQCIIKTIEKYCSAWVYWWRLQKICLDWCNEVPNFTPKEVIKWTDIVDRNDRKWRRYWSWNGFIVLSFTLCHTKIAQISIILIKFSLILQVSIYFRTMTMMITYPFRYIQVWKLPWGQFFSIYIIILGQIFYRAQTSFIWKSKRFFIIIWTK